MKIEFKKILAIGAHFDDIEINCGGTLARFSKSGVDIKIVVVGDGNYRHYDGTVLRESEKASQEGLDAINKLCIDKNSLINLKYPEKRIEFDEKLIEDLEKIIDNYKPDLIITHWLHDSHQDHISVSKAVISASRYYYSLWMWEPIFPSGRDSITPYIPQVYVDVSEYIQMKNEAIGAHKTQVDKFYSRRIKWIEGIEARSKYRGFESGLEQAETFFVYRHRI